VLMARTFTGNNDVIAVRNSIRRIAEFDGSHVPCHWKFPAQVSQHPPHHYPDPTAARSAELRKKSPRAAPQTFVTWSDTRTPGRVAAFIAEPIQGVGGTTLGAPNYLREAYAITREFGGLCIADEVQTGFGRTGDHFWGFEASGVVPIS